MARASVTDHLQAHKFQLLDLPTNLISAFKFAGGFSGNERFAGGFSSVSFPDIDIETQSISEANWPFERTIITRATVGNMTLEKGVLPRDSDFFLFAMGALFGRQLSRRNLFLTANRRNGRPAKGWMIWGAVPESVKLAGDFDATTAEVSIASMDLNVEMVEELPGGFEVDGLLDSLNPFAGF